MYQINITIPMSKLEQLAALAALIVDNSDCISGTDERIDNVLFSMQLLADNLAALTKI